jgi:5S rRNA maturation endonuclease (ribonuclease M5)
MSKFKTLEEFTNQFPGKRLKTSKGVNVICPAHDDHNPSLSISQSNGKILLHCQAGCLTESILKAKNMTEGDLFLNGNTPPQKPIKKRIAEYIYQDESGKPLFRVARYFPKDFEAEVPDPDNPGKWLTGRGVMTGVRRVLYHLPKVLQGIKDGQNIYICAGEKDADRLINGGINSKHPIATTNAFGENTKWLPEYSESLRGADVVIFTDPDEPGKKHVREVAQNLNGIAKTIKIIPPLKTTTGRYGDVTDYLDSGTITDLLKIVDETPYWKPESISPLEPKTENTGNTETVQAETPDVSKTNRGYKFIWTNLNLEVRIERLNNDAIGIVKVLDGGNIIHTSNINLLATRSIAELSNKLQRLKKADWDRILSYIVNYCTTALEDTGAIENIDTPPASMKVEYLLEPILPKNEPTTIFTAGGKGKSILADYIAVLVQNGLCSDGGLPLLACQTNVLYLDWEADAETHRRYVTAIKRGLNLPESGTIQYLKLDHPLSKVVDRIRTAIEEKEIGLVIIDSQMAATSSGTQGLSEAQIASEYYNDIRSFGCTTLTIDHITKQGMSNEKGAEAPYGSVVKYNRSRSQFELRLPDEDENNDHKEFALVHRKYNLGRKQNPLGIAVDFTNNDNELVKITFQSCDIKDSPSLSKVMTIKDRIESLLKREGVKLDSEIADSLGESVDTVGRTLRRYRDKTFVRLNDGSWGLIIR